MANNTNPTSGDTTQTGQDAVLKVGGEEFAVTNVSFTKDVETSEIQQNDSLTPDIAVTGLRFSGSFEHAGENEALRDAIEWTAEGSRNAYYHEEMEPRRPNIVVKEYAKGEGSRTTTFKNCLVSSRSKDMPSDDTVSVTYDFVAEEMSFSE